MLKNSPVTITYMAWNNSTGAGQPGDAANHTIRGVGDGTEFTPANTPVEVDGTILQGVYSLTLTALEANYNDLTIGGKSSTSGVVIFPRFFSTDQGSLPHAAPGVENGLFIAGVNAATTITGSLTTTIIGDLNGNVGGDIQGDLVGKVLGTGLTPFTGVGVSANTVQFNGHDVVLDNNNYPGVNIVDVGGTAASMEVVVSANITEWNGAPVGAVPLNDKTGYSLAPTGLDQIAITDPGGVSGHTTFPKILVALYRYFFRKRTMTSTQIKTYGDNGTTVNTTQAASDDNTTQTIGAST